MTTRDRIRERLARLLLGAEPVDVDAALTHIAAVLAAWEDPGPFPPAHRGAQQRLRRDWPALASALDAATAHTAPRGPHP